MTGLVARVEVAMAVAREAEVVDSTAVPNLTGSGLDTATGDYPAPSLPVFQRLSYAVAPWFNY